MVTKMSGKSMVTATVVLLSYFIFTSGAVYEATGSEVTDRLVVPYSIPLSGERTGLIGIFAIDDRNCAEWIVKNVPKGMSVVCDGNMGLFLRSYEFAGTEQIDYFSGEFSPDPHYLLISTWNTESGKMVVSATSAGLRGLKDVPEIDKSVYDEVFRSGKSVIYVRR